MFGFQTTEDQKNEGGSLLSFKLLNLAIVLSLTNLLVLGLMLLEHRVLILFNDLDSCVLDGLTNEHLENGLNFIFVIEQVGVTFEYLSGFHFSFGVRNENSRWWTVDVVVWLDVCFRDPIISIT